MTDNPHNIVPPEEPTGQRRRANPKEMGLLVALAAVILAADQATKHLVQQHLPLGAEWAPIPAISRWFTFTHIPNTGASFGLFPQLGTVFMLISIAVVIGILVFSRQLTPQQRLLTVSLGLQLGGAMGNLTDRLRIGHVVDFIDVKVWPIFNVADSCIVLGVGLLLWVFFRAPEQLGPLGAAPEKPKAPSPADE